MMYDVVSSESGKNGLVNVRQAQSNSCETGTILSTSGRYDPVCIRQERCSVYEEGAITD